MDLEFFLTLSFNLASGQPRVLQLSQQMLFYGALSLKRFVVGRATREKS